MTLTQFFKVKSVYKWKQKLKLDLDITLYTVKAIVIP